MRARSVRLLCGLLALMVSVVVLAACSTGPSQHSQPDTKTSTQRSDKTDTDAFPVTVKHAFGSTTIKQEPKKVAALGWGVQDNALALGVAPVGASKLDWGGNKHGSAEWFDQKLDKLDADAPQRYDDSDGAPVEKIAKLNPDLILATNSGVTKKEYKKLSKIAPVVAYPKAPWTTPWQKSLTMAGKALGRSQQAEKVLTKTKKRITAARKKYPQIVDKSVVFGFLSTSDLSTIGIYGPQDPRVSFMNDLGMVNAPIVKDAVKSGEFYGSVSAERGASVKSDVFLTWSEKPDDMKKFAKNGLLGDIPAIKNGHAYAEEDERAAVAVSSPTPLSIPYALKHFVPGVAKAANRS